MDLVSVVRSVSVAMFCRDGLLGLGSGSGLVVSVAFIHSNFNLFYTLELTHVVLISPISCSFSCSIF